MELVITSFFVHTTVAQKVMSLLFSKNLFLDHENYTLQRVIFDSIPHFSTKSLSTSTALCQ
jgi:hypothetical protein